MVEDKESVVGKTVLSIVTLLCCCLSSLPAQEQEIVGFTPFKEKQKVAVFFALAKLVGLSFEWEEDDARHASLGRLLEAWSNGKIGNGAPGACHGKAGYAAVTCPVDGFMSPVDCNPIKLNPRKWSGPSCDFFQTNKDVIAACNILAAVLLHEGSHQDDSFPVPTPTAPGPSPLTPEEEERFCEEIDAHCQEQRTLEDFLDTESRVVIDLMRWRTGRVAANKTWYEERKRPV